MTNKKIKIVTIGDSLTQGNPPPEFRHGNPGKYQSFLYYYLKDRNLEPDIWNFGIGGELMCQIINRLEPTLPADFIVIMGGTNDAWRFSLAGEDIESEIADDILENLQRCMDIIKKHPKSQEIIPIICSIPPMANIPSIDPKIILTIKITNLKIKEFCEKNRVFFCDVNKAMRLNEMEEYADPKNVVADGVHFTPAGNKKCGEAIGKKIFEIIKS
ncbi:MAG: SGNH/GDSL hydrolase family protein [Promethearchaeota archaeon]